MILNKWTLRPKAVDRPTEIEDPAVIFIDYDGTELYTYSLDEANALTELPANPTHDGLVSQGWNWTLAQIKGQLLDTPETTVVVGQLYVTASGATEIDIELGDVWKSPYLTMGVNGTATIDWGDNSTADTVAGTNITTKINTQHVYANSGSYTIKITVTNGSARLIGVSGTRPFFSNIHGSPEYNRQYSNAVKAVRTGNDIEYGDSALLQCGTLEYITFSSTTVSMGSEQFRACKKLKALTIPYTQSYTIINPNFFRDCYSANFISLPYGITEIGHYAFHTCISLKQITIPSTVESLNNDIFMTCTSLKKAIIPSTTEDCSSINFNSSRNLRTVIFKGGVKNGAGIAGQYPNCSSLETVVLPYNCTWLYVNTFSGCVCLKNVSLPQTITKFDKSVFYNCRNLESITIPSAVTSIGTNAFNGCRKLKSIEFPEGLLRIENQTCMGCNGLSSVIIPSTVNFIASYAFRNDMGMKEFHIKPTTPPELENVDAFSSIPNDCIFYVPRGSLSAYQNATNWSDFASYMQEE